MERPRLNPAPGTRLLRHVGDRLRVELEGGQAPGWRAFLRTNLTRGERARAEVVALAGRGAADPGTFAGASWRDLPLRPEGGRWGLDLILTEPGHFRAKAYAVDPAGRQHWPEGEDLGISEKATDAQILDAMVEHPVLVERPFVESPKGTLLARPKEKVRDIL